MRRACCPRLFATVTAVVAVFGARTVVSAVELFNEDDTKYKLRVKEGDQPERQIDFDPGGHLTFGPDVRITLMGTGISIQAKDDERWSVKDEKFIKRSRDKDRVRTPSHG